MVSLRGANKHAAWCSNYEFEDVICEVDHVDRLHLEPGYAYETRQWFARRLVWKPGLRLLTPYVNPGLKPIVLERDYELFIYVCMNPADLIYLSAVKGWKERCQKKVCFMVEFYALWQKEYAFHLGLLQDFDHIALAFSGSVDAIRAATGRPCHHVPLAADVFRFSPFPAAPARCIDVYSMGRRNETVHDALLSAADRREIFYIYDTIPGALIQPSDHRQHRNLIANCAKRSRFFIAYPAKVDVAEETRGQSDVGARFFEGAAAGAVLLGQAPTVPAFASEFNWNEAVVNVPPTAEGVQAVLDRFLADPTLAKRVGHRNALEAVRRFDWSHRWQEILEIAGLEPVSPLTERATRLSALEELVKSRTDSDGR